MSIKSYWAQLDELIFQALENTVWLIDHISITKIYNNDLIYIERLKNRYFNLIKSQAQNAVFVGDKFYNDVIKRIGDTPKGLTNKELQLAYNNAKKVTQGYINAAIDDFVNDFKAQVVNMKALRIPKNQVVKYFQQEQRQDRPFFNRYRNRMTKIIDDAVDRAASMTYGMGIEKQYKGVTDETLFIWIAVGDKRTCPDCKRRHKRVMMFGEWKKVGIPQAGYTFCLSSCRCIIVPDQYYDPDFTFEKHLIRPKYHIREGKIIK